MFIEFNFNGIAFEGRKEGSVFSSKIQNKFEFPAGMVIIFTILI